MHEKTLPKMSAEKEFAGPKNLATWLNKITISGLKRGQVVIQQLAKCTLPTSKGVNSPKTGLK